MNLRDICIQPSSSLRHAIHCIDRGAKGIALVVDHEQRLLGTITDGDIRRAILESVSLDVPVSQILERKKITIYPKPITAQVGDSHQYILQLMDKYSIRQVPLLDKIDKVVDLIVLEEIIPGEELPIQAVIMAGGYGTRLSPLTDELPKPMLPVGDRPLIEHIIGQLQQTGIQQLHITTHYKANMIREHFGDGQAFGVSINYVKEDQPLGTAGALGLMDAPKEPLLVINGDILTRVDFRAMLNYHRKHNADLTVGVRQYDVDVPYGVVEREGPFVKQLREKPRYSFFVNAGIYLLQPSVYQYIPREQRYDMTNLIDCLIQKGKPVVSFPIIEYWLDVGQPVDYQQAQDDVKNGRV